MAYDQNSAYEPPRRPYMTQTQLPQPRPVYDNYADYAQGPYDHYDQGYSQDYQQNGQGSGHGYEQSNAYRQQPTYDDTHSGGYGGQQQGNAQYYRQDEGRSYDPRYQPRAQRAPPPQPRQAPPPAVPGRDPYQSEPRGTSRQNGQRAEPAIQRPDPHQQRDGYPPQAQAYDEPYGAQQVYNGDPRTRPQDPQRIDDQRYGHYDVPQTARTEPRSQRQGELSQTHVSKASMEAWKAQERAKFKNAAMSPETQNFDNAFPVFGKKAQREPDRSGGVNIHSGRPSGEHGGRPPTSHERRPQMSRENDYRTQNGMQSAPPRPDMNRQYSEESAMSRPRTAPSNRQDLHARPQNDRYQNENNVTTPVREDYPESWPMVPGQTPPKVQSQRRSPPRVDEHALRYAPSQEIYGQTNQHPAVQPLSKQRRPPNMHRIDTAQAQEQQQPVHGGHQPLSPAMVPPRPSTSHGSRAAPRQQLTSPTSLHTQSAFPRDTYDSLPAKPWAQEEQQTKHASLGDIYDDYNTTPPPRRLERAPTNRDEEIEAEMPDFDSAAPGQTSSMHKRMQTMDKHLADAAAVASPPPPLPRTQTAPLESMPQSQSAHDLRYTQRQYGVSPSPAQNGPHRGPPTAHTGYAPAPPSAPERQYDIPYRNSPTHLPYDQNAPLPTPQAPYANEPQVRRSIDDGRGTPYRQGPPSGHRMPPNGQAARGPLPPQHRPGFDRNPTNQTVWSDPGQERGGSAPPLQSGARMLPGVPAGLPPDQARPASNPDALPHHPMPVRAGHIVPQGNAQPTKPPPVRNYAAASGAQDPPHQRQASVEVSDQPVTHNELARLRGSVDNGQSGPKNHLVLVKKLVEASTVLAGTTEAGGRCDSKTAAKNRDRYLNEAYKRLKKLVAGGYPSAQFYMADCYGQGMLGLEPDTKEAFKLYQAAAKAGHPQAAYRTAVCCEMGPDEGGGTNKDYPKAVQWYRRAATLGDPAAMYKLGAILLKGLLGQQRNIGEAVTWLKRAAERADQDNPHALHELATLYESSNKNPEVRNKVIADDAYAKDLYMQAAKLGYKFSQFKLGQAYEYGSLGLPINNRDSIAWYTKAAAQGEHQAELALSGWYLTGAEGILEHSDTEAYLWARKAASSEGGPQVGKAMFAMGYFTENGIGCPASMEEARKWYGRAASYKFPKALERIEELRKGGGKGGKGPAPVNGRLTRKDQKRDEENCVIM